MLRCLGIAALLLVAAPAAAQSPAVPTEAAPDTEADAATALDTQPAAAPKIAVVVAGDPDDTIRNTAAFLETEASLSGLRIPSDPALSAALRGETPAQEDGLEGLRSIRRGLGVDPTRDLASYRKIGAIAGADALVVLRREGSIVIEVFDVSAVQFYEGELPFAQSTTAQRTKFIESRAEQAQLRWTQPSAPAPTVTATPAPAAAPPDAPRDEPEEPRAKRRWKKAWPYVVAGMLLAGGVTYLIIDRRRTDEVGLPLLRFRPGEE